jgi:TPP-dependent 2-oxoacid decarboxylase
VTRASLLAVADTRTVHKKVEGADLYLFIGALRSDFNTASSFTEFTRQADTIEFHSDRTQVFDQHFDGIGMKELLPKVAALLAESKKDRTPNELHPRNEVRVSALHCPAPTDRRTASVARGRGGGGGP